MHPSDVPEVDPSELHAAIAAGGPLQVLDVRPPAMVSSGRVELAPGQRFANQVGSRIFAGADLAAEGLDPRQPLTVVCARGIASRQVTAHLNQLGWQARSMRGGMAAWMRLVVPRRLPPPPGLELLVQLDRAGKGALGYLLAAGGEGLLIDPPRDASVALGVAAEARVRLVAIADTHVHADYLSGGPMLAGALGVPYHLHPGDAVDPFDGTPGPIAFSPVADGDTLRVGGAAIRVEHTPGHTLGSVTYRLGDALAFTGDFLFVGSVGRPDIAGRAEEWSGDLWRSLERARASWPDELLVLPAHYAGAAERRADGAVGRPFGVLRRENPALGIGDAAAFAGWVRARTTAVPAAYRQIKAANLGLLTLDDEAAGELEAGRNQCAVG